MGVRKETAMTLNTYLFFDGDCGDAFDFYRRVFGGGFTARMTYAEGPAEAKVDESERGKIMHVSLPVGSSVLMGSDVAKGHGEAPRPSNAFAISYSAASREDADAKFAALQEGGGSASMPMADTFWGAYFGMLKDRFGVHWMVSHDRTAG
jgi:PhnB protein